MPLSAPPPHDHTARVLDAVLTLATSSLPSAAGFSVTVITGEAQTTPASSAPWAAALDAGQFDLGCGPCVDAALGGENREMTDASTETRWPDYVAAALAVQVQSSLSVPLPSSGDVVGSLNAFALTAGAFDDDDRAVLVRLAATAAAGLHPPDVPFAPGSARSVVDQAKGILMSKGCSPSQALDQLGRSAQTTGRNLRSVAAELVADTSRT